MNAEIQPCWLISSGESDSDSAQSSTTSPHGSSATVGAAAPSAVRPQIPAADVATGKPTLRRGARGEDGEAVQKGVGVKADGKFGPLTEAAVRRFQREHGLVADGIVGPKTWAAVLAATPRVQVVEMTGSDGA